MNPIFEVFSVFSLGLVTQLHPCPLTTNLSIFSYMAGGFRRQLSTNLLLYLAGYLIALLAIVYLLSYGLSSIPTVNLFLKSRLLIFLGPVLMLAGMLIAGIIKIPGMNRQIWKAPVRWLHHITLTMSFLMGIIIALSFCPATAAVFFGAILPIASNSQNMPLIVAAYGIGSVIPVAIASVIASTGMRNALKPKSMKKIQEFLGWIMVAIGIYLTIIELYI